MEIVWWKTFCTHTHTAQSHHNFLSLYLFQIIFDGFTVGRFDEGNADNDFETTDVSLMSTSGSDLPGCPDGFMQVRRSTLILTVTVE